MRLTNQQTGADASVNGGGENPTTDQQRLNMSTTRRGRSSLDYKGRGRNEEPSNQAEPQLLTTKPGKRKNPHQQQQEEQQHEEQQQQIYHRRAHPSRARGSSGPPPKKFELSDLEHMNEEELLQALYSDPELAQEAARIAETMQQQEKKKRSSASSRKSRRNARTESGRSGSKKSTARKEFSEYPDHMREMMDGGVPVMQWVILFVLVGAALYQLRKILILPDSKGNKGGVRASRGIGIKKGVKKGEKRTKSFTPPNVGSSVKKAAQIIEKDVVPPSNKAIPKFAIKGASNIITKKKKKSRPASETSPKPSALSNSGSAAKRELETDKVTVASPSIQTSTEIEDDGAGWQTVSKVRIAPEPEISTDAKGSSGDNQSDAKEVMPDLTNDKENVPDVDTVTPSKVATKPTHISNGKKKNKTKAMKGGELVSSESDVSNKTSNTEDDEALALKLQLEEENLAQTGENGGSEDVWEEVATRNRKGSKQADAVA